MSDIATGYRISQALSAIACGSPAAARYTSELADYVTDPELKAHIKGSVRYSIMFGEQVAPFLTDFDVPRFSDNLILHTQYQVDQAMIAGAPDARGRDMAAIEGSRMALGYWGPLFSSLKLHAEKAGHEKLVAVAVEALEGIEKADEAAIAFIRRL